MHPFPRSTPFASAHARRLARHIATLGLGLIGASFAHAADFYKADNESNLELTAAWVNSDNTPVTVAPVNSTSSTDTWIWDNRVTAAADVGLDGIQNVTVGSGKDLGVRTIRIIDPALPIVFNGNGRTFTPTTTGGIDMSLATQDFTLQNLIYRVASSGATIDMNVATGRTLTFDTGATVTVRSNSSGVTVNLNTDTASAGTIRFTASFAPSFVVIGGGVVEFSNPSGNTRLATNSTTVNGGTLIVNNTTGSATGSGPVAVNANATLGGAGIIAGAVTAATDSILAPGANGVGTLSVGSLTLETGSNYVWEATNTVDADQIIVTSSDGLVLNGGVIHLHNPGTTDPFTGVGVFTLIGCTGAIGGSGIESLSIAEETKIEGRFYTLSLGANGVTLRITNGLVTPIDWATDASGNWSAGSNWTGGSAPDAVAALARITGSTGATFTAPRTVTLDAPHTVGQLFLDSTQPVTLAGASTLTFNDDGAAATLTASGANHLIATPLSLSSGGMLATVEGASTTLSVTGVVSGAAQGLIKIGDGTLLLTANNTYTGNTSVSAGTLQIGAGGSTGSVAGSLSVSGLIRFNRSDSITLAQPVSGTGAVEFAGSGDTTLSVANTYSGGTTLSAGTLILANGQALQNSTLTYSTGGGSLVVADPVAAVTLGALAGDRALPLTNTLGAPLALTVGGNGASTTYSGSPLGTGLTFTKTGSGSLTLTGTHSYDDTAATTPVGTLISAGTLELGTGAEFNTPKLQVGTGSNAKLTISGGTLNASAEVMVKNATQGLEITSGVANFTGGLRTDFGSSSGTNIIRVLGGTLNAASIRTGRGGATLSSDAATGRTTDGLYIHGGTVNVSGLLNLGADTGVNSSLSSRMDSGTLNVTGLTTLGISSPDRWAVLDINGGTFNADGGIQLGSAFSGLVVMHIRNASAVVNTPGIQLGQADLGGQATLSLSAGTLYVGAGGINLGTTNPAFVPTVKLLGGTIGATADWSSTLPLGISDTLFTVTGADASNTPHTVLLQGPVSGLGSLAKTGAGTVLFDNPANDYFGPTTISGGTLGLAGKTSDTIMIEAGATLRTTAPLQVAFSPVHVNGTLSVGYNAAATNPVNTLTTSLDAVNIDANATLHISGTGTLPGPFHVLVQAPLSGINGTFAPANVTGIPAGFVLDQAYDDDADPGTPPVIALVGSGVASPYETWTTSYSLTGNDALLTADPDADGMNNLLEYALDTDPTLGDTASAFTVGRSGNHLTLAFDHAGDSTLTYEVQATNDLATPFTTIHTFAPFTTEGSEIFTDTAVDLTVTPRRFLRLKVTTAP